MKTEKEIVQQFFEQVRSGKQLDSAYELMQDEVTAHQVQSENEYSIKRTPADYIDHVEEMLELYGDFTLDIQEILQEEEKVYVRWKQMGQLKNGRKMIELASAVYLVKQQKISEYWIQIDRKGLEIQERAE